jgi:phospholipase C
MADEKPDNDLTQQPETPTELGDSPSRDDSPRQKERRRFIQAAALGAAALTTGALNPLESMANAASPQETPSAGPIQAAPKFDHLVVLMMENRSFDHMLGRLYSPENPPPYDKPLRGQKFDGVQPSMSNPVSPVYNWLPKTVPVSRTMEYETPPDDLVGHQFQDAEMQVGSASAARHMQGFVNNRVLNLDPKKKPPLSQVQAPMEGFSPTEHTTNGDRPYAAVTVLSTLANSFAVCDNWYCSLPGPTLVNRSFLHAGTSNNWVSNGHNWNENKNQTVFNRLGDGEWNIYNGDGDTICLTSIIHPTITWNPRQGNSIAKFVADAAAGTLAKYSFVEPEVIGYDSGKPPDDQHPPRDVRLGETLINTVYQAVRTSPLWPRTLLIIVYDEHGGFFDHVYPPKAIPPHLDDPPGEDGFRFESLGVRVPAVLVSPLIQPGTVFHPSRPVDHTAIIKTLCNRFGLQPLTLRDRNAVDLAEVLGSSLRPIEETPELPEWPIPESEMGVQPLNDLQRELVMQAANTYGVELPPMTNTQEAKEFMRSLSRMVVKAS